MMRRDPTLGRPSQHHARGLAQARALRRAAAKPLAVRERATRAFLEYFDDEVLPHCREEELTLFPRMLAHDAPAEAVALTLAEHEWLQVLARRLREAVGDRGPIPELLRELSALLYRHITREEIELLPSVRGAGTDTATPR